MQWWSRVCLVAGPACKSALIVFVTIDGPFTPAYAAVLTAPTGHTTNMSKTCGRNDKTSVRGHPQQFSQSYLFLVNRDHLRHGLP